MTFEFLSAVRFGPRNKPITRTAGTLSGLVLSALMFALLAYATLAQAAQIVAKLI